MMLKTTFKIGALVAIAVIGYPVLHYRAVSPCEMLRKELIWQMEDRIEAVAAAAAEQVESLGIDSVTIEGDLEEKLGDVAAGIAAGAAEAKVRRMSSAACARELWRITVGGDEAFAETP